MQGGEANCQVAGASMLFSRSLLTIGLRFGISPKVLRQRVAGALNTNVIGK